jgi:hypothetical protein
MLRYLACPQGIKKLRGVHQVVPCWYVEAVRGSGSGAAAGI